VDKEFTGDCFHERFDLVFANKPRERESYWGEKDAHCQLCKGEICDVTQENATIENAVDECNYDGCLACFKG
jgi:hypothetical protein